MGAEALRTLGKLLARRNHDGGSREDVELAIAMIERAGGTEKVIGEVLKPGVTDVKDWRLHKIPKPLALGFEIAAHEESERRAVAGELALVRGAAAGAEAQAAIAEGILGGRGRLGFTSRYDVKSPEYMR